MEISRSFNALTVMNYLMEDGLSEKENIFQEKFDKAKHRIIDFFLKKSKMKHKQNLLPDLYHSITLR